VYRKLLLEGRTQPISEEQVRGLLKTNCKQFKPTKLIYRGLKTPFEYGMVDPKKGSSIYTESESYYSFLVDWFWKKYPKRGQSVIGSLDRKYASNFGSNVYIVVPFDNAHFGVAPDNDFWNGFKYVNRTLKIPDMLEFDRLIGDLIGKPKSNRRQFFDLLNKVADKLNDKDKVKEVLEKIKGKHFRYESFLEYILNSKDDFKTSLQNLFDPERNGFKQDRYNNLAPRIFRSNYEVWTDSKCLLINENVFNKVVTADITEAMELDTTRRKNANDMIAKRRLANVDRDNMDAYTKQRVCILEQRYK